MTDSLLQYTEILSSLDHAHKLQYQHWLHYELFTWQWWMLLGLLVFPWGVWWRFVDRKRTGTILAYGLYIMFVVSMMDTLGEVFQLWFYPIKLIPILHFTAALDWGILSVLHMLIYQYFSKWKSFIVAESILSAVLAFALEPITEYIGIYFVLHWYHYWSFPIYVMKAVIGKLLIDSIVYRDKFES